MTNDFVWRLEIGPRAHTALLELGVTDVDTFMAVTADDILPRRNCGKKTWGEIRDLQEHFRNVANGGADFATIRSLLGQVNRLWSKHPYFTIDVVRIPAGTFVRVNDTRTLGGPDFLEEMQR